MNKEPSTTTNAKTTKGRAPAKSKDKQEEREKGVKRSRSQRSLVDVARGKTLLYDFNTNLYRLWLTEPHKIPHPRVIPGTVLRAQGQRLTTILDLTSLA